MPLSVHKRYEIVFLSNHSLGAQLNYTDVAKAVHCSTWSMKYWLKRWMQSKDLTDSTQSGRPRATTPKQDQRIVLLAEEHTFVTVQDIAKQLKRQWVVVSERIVRRRLNGAGVKYNRPMSKSLLTEHHRQSRLKWAQDHKTTNWNIFWRNYCPSEFCERTGLELAREKESRSYCQASYQSEYLELFLK